MNITNTEYKPSHGLGHYIESFWSYYFDAPSRSVSPSNICIPKGTVELIFTLNGGSAELLQNGHWLPLADVLLAGIQTAPSMWRACGGTEIFGIRIKPETFFKLFGISVAEIYQKHMSVHLVTGTKFNWLIDLIRQAKNTRERVAIAESFFYKKLALSKHSNSLLTEALRKIWAEEGNITTASLSKYVYIGERQLQRIFKNEVGISPKLYSRIIRFKMAYERASAGRPSAWTDVAYDYGYTDQAHFVKDFKCFTGVTPTALFN